LESLDINYGTAVKRYLKENLNLVEVHRFHAPDVQFDDALVLSTVVVFEKRTAPAGHWVRSSLGGSLAHPQVSEEVPARSLGRLQPPRHSLVYQPVVCYRECTFVLSRSGSGLWLRQCSHPAYGS
jgi:hypothetical protein